METKSLDFIQSVQFLQGLLPENKSKEMMAYKPSPNPRFPCPASSQIRKEPLPLQTFVKNIGIRTSKQLNQTSDDVSDKINRQDQLIEQLNDKINRLERQLAQLKSFVIEQVIEKSKNTKY